MLRDRQRPSIKFCGRLKPTDFRLQNDFLNVGERI
jgi:hypothetical protein